MILRVLAPQVCTTQPVSIPSPAYLALRAECTLSGFFLSQSATSVRPLPTRNGRREGWVDGSFGALLIGAVGSSLKRVAVQYENQPCSYVQGPARPVEHPRMAHFAGCSVVYVLWCYSRTLTTNAC